MTLPQAPCFSVAKQWHTIEFQAEIKTKCTVTRLALIHANEMKCEVFDANGMVWSEQWERPARGFGFWDKVIVQFHNPCLEVAVTWTFKRHYELEELRALYLDAIDHDDDILTQFVEADELKARVSKCATFADLVKTWEWMSSEQT